MSLFRLFNWEVSSVQYTDIDDLHLSKLTLGTAQLRQKYGIANKNGKPGYKKSGEIIKAAIDGGINCFDTAPYYGDSEKIIGSYISSYPALLGRLVTVTKLTPFELEDKVDYTEVLEAVRRQVLESAKRLRLRALPIYLLHSAADMDTYEGLIIESLRQLRTEGLIGRAGVAVYTPEEAEQALGIDVLSAIQIPINMFDHRLISTGLLKRLAERQFVIFVRSLFLQGLFLLDPTELPKGLELAELPLIKLIQLAARHERSVAEMAVAFVRDLPGITSVVIGAETAEQIRADIELMDCPPLSQALRDEIMSEFSGLPLELVNPSLWNLG